MGVPQGKGWAKRIKIEVLYRGILVAENIKKVKFAKMGEGVAGR